LIFDLVQL